MHEGAKSFRVRVRVLRLLTKASNDGFPEQMTPFIVHFTINCMRHLNNRQNNNNNNKLYFILWNIIYYLLFYNHNVNINIFSGQKTFFFCFFFVVRWRYAFAGYGSEVSSPR